MITNKRLKIWTIIFQGFIIVGFGHGIAIFALIEIFWFPYFTKEQFSFAFDASFESHLPVIGLTTLLGQVALIFSILNKGQHFKSTFQIAGLLLLWLSVIYFIHDAAKDTYIYFAAITCVPFAICTIITFVGQPIRKFYNWVLK